jgi:hypothetical protein
MSSENEQDLLDQVAKAAGSEVEAPGSFHDGLSSLVEELGVPTTFKQAMAGAERCQLLLIRNKKVLEYLKLVADGAASLGTCRLTSTVADDQGHPCVVEFDFSEVLQEQIADPDAREQTLQILVAAINNHFAGLVTRGVKEQAVFAAIAAARLPMAAQNKSKNVE